MTRKCKSKTKEEHAVFVPIEDENSRKFWEESGYKVRTVYFAPKKRMYAIVPAESEEERKFLQNLYDADLKREQRYYEKFGGFVSYEQLMESEYDPGCTYITPEDEVMGLMAEENIMKIVSELSEENQRLFHMLVKGEYEKDVAKELGIPTTTLNYKKNKLKKALKVLLKELL